MTLNLYGPAFQLTTADRVIQEGDSISALDTNTQMPMLIKRRWSAKCEATPGGPKGFWVNTAVSATGVAASLARINTALAKYAPTKLIAVYGTADWILGTAVATFNTNFNLILDALCGIGIPVYIAGTMLVGEKWPTGQNATDLTIGDPYIAAMIAGVARYPTLATFRDMRASVYAIQEPLLNVPGPGVTIGPLTRPDGTAAHHNPGGRGLCDNIVNGDITIVDATATAVYAGTSPPNQSALVSWKNADDPALADGANVTAWLDRIRQIGTNAAGSMDLTITPATKPVYKTPAQAGKINNKPAVQSGGATYMQSAALLTTPIPQPCMVGIVWQQVNLTGNQIITDSTPATSFDFPVLNATGALQPAAPTTFNPVPSQRVAAVSWNCAIVVYAGSKSFSVLNGYQSLIGDVGPNAIDRDFFFASATGPGGLPFTGMIRERLIYAANTYTGLPRWQDLYQYFVNQYGAFPQ